MKNKKLEEMQDKLIHISGNIMAQTLYGNKKAVKQLQAEKENLELKIKKLQRNK